MKVGVFDMGGAGWTGGVTYLRNLGHAVRTTIPEQLNLFLIRQTVPSQGKEDPVSDYFDGVVEVTPFGGTRHSHPRSAQYGRAREKQIPISSWKGISS